jgi:hypothetical protein
MDRAKKQLVNGMEANPLDASTSTTRKNPDTVRHRGKA